MTRIKSIILTKILPIMVLGEILHIVWFRSL